MNTRTLSAALAASLLTCSLTAGAQFTNVLTEGEVDFGIKYDAAEGWEFELHDETNNVEYELGETLLVAPEDARLSRPGGVQWDFLGVGAGESVWVLPQNEISGLLYFGVGSEEMTGDVFDSYFEADARVNDRGRWIKTTVAAVRGPGQFSVWTTDQNGNPTVWAATADGLQSSDALFGVEGGHTHYNWGFTAAGRYEIDVVVSAFQGGALLQSDVATINFDVVPEPATILALAAGLAAVASRRRR